MTLVDSLIEVYVKPAVPTPPGFTSREIVRRAIEFASPPRIPYSFMQPLKSDFVELAVVVEGAADISNVPVGEMVFDEWGVGRRSSGTAWGNAEVHPLNDLSALDGYRFPDVTAPERFRDAETLARAGREAGKYVVGADPILGIERLRLLVGFSDLMLALYTDRPRVERLLDRLVEMTLEVVRAYAGMGTVDGFMTWEDWGLQTTLQIKPEQWREIFKPRYARVVEATHAAGMHYLFHCCGQISDIIPDLIDIGMDVLQLDQPRLMGVDRLADEFGGKICFWNTVDIQWSPLPEVTLDELRAEVKHMVEAFGRFNGGLIARHYPQPKDIAMPPEKHQAIYEAFMEYGCGLPREPAQPGS
jgi:uroporphyrinogen decarboxylase